MLTGSSPTMRPSRYSRKGSSLELICLGFRPAWAPSRSSRRMVLRSRPVWRAIVHELPLADHLSPSCCNVSCDRSNLPHPGWAGNFRPALSGEFHTGADNCGWERPVRPRTQHGSGAVLRRQRLYGLINEYHHAALGTQASPGRSSEPLPKGSPRLV